MIEAPKAFPDPRVEHLNKDKQNPCSEVLLEAPTACTLKVPDYDPRDQIIANLSIDNEVLRNRLKEYANASKEIRDALDAARDKFAQFRNGYYY